MSFRTTRWSLVLAAAADGDGREKALQELCSLYWPPVYAFFRSSGHAEENALDLTQGLFAYLLERDDLARAVPSTRNNNRFRHTRTTPYTACNGHSIGSSAMTVMKTTIVNGTPTFR